MRALRWVGVVAIVAVALVGVTAYEASAGGGIAPPPCHSDGTCAVFVPVKHVSVSLMLDPHGVFSPIPGSTPGQGIITLQNSDAKNPAAKQATAMFLIPPFAGSLGELVGGCDLSLTPARFVNTNTAGSVAGNYNPLSNFIVEPTVEWLFGQVGITVDAFNNLTPGIAAVTFQQCVPSPDTGTNNPGYLQLQGSLGFWTFTPATVPNPR